ncbi:MAG: hypothetical protein GYB65_09245 [Chloroflexi bacterium]|nr:hypothetical protein [Chloroflexota bacterium]
MRHKLLFMAGLGLVVMGLALLPAPAHSTVVTSPSVLVQPAFAQCGGDVSSCKTCHQGEEAFPVNENGAWHIDHADNDFCADCHGGDTSSDDAIEAHAGMQAVMGLDATSSTACVECHLNDAPAYSQAYGDLLLAARAEAEAAANAAAAADAAASDAGAANTVQVPVAPVIVVQEDSSTDWRNIALAGFAGVLTMVSGLVVWNYESLGDRLRAFAHRDDLADGEE